MTSSAAASSSNLHGLMLFTAEMTVILHDLSTDEKLVEVSRRWRELSAEEKSQYSIASKNTYITNIMAPKSRKQKYSWNDIDLDESPEDKYDTFDSIEFPNQDIAMATLRHRRATEDEFNHDTEQDITAVDETQVNQDEGGEQEENVSKKQKASMFRGVSRHSNKKKWVAHTTVRGMGRVYVGTYDDEITAAKARDEYNLKFNGRKASTLFKFTVKSSKGIKKS